MLRFIVNKYNGCDFRVVSSREGQLVAPVRFNFEIYKLRTVVEKPRKGTTTELAREVNKLSSLSSPGQQVPR